MTTSEAWGRFFSALGVKVTDEGSHVAIDGIGNGWGGGPLRLIYTDFPPTPEGWSAAAALAEEAGDYVAFLFGRPHLPTARLTWHANGGKGAELVRIDKNGAAWLFTPESRRGWEKPDQLPRDLLWYCIQEDADGNLGFWPMHIEALPVGTRKYTMAVHSPTTAGDIVPSVYVGYGISPHGHRLVRALQALGPRAYATEALVIPARRVPVRQPAGGLI